MEKTVKLSGIKPKVRFPLPFDRSEFVKGIISEEHPEQCQKEPERIF
jgi:hypothetical protein